MPGTSSAKTRFALLPGHDEEIAINATSVKSIPRPFRRALRTLRRNACFDFIRGEDRKSTRLNSSHTVISYAVFCLKKKKNSRRRTSDHGLYCMTTAYMLE